MVLKNDLRYVKSEEAFKQAFLELLDEMPKEKISISLLCERARCSRPAFYNHYVDKEDLYAAIIHDFVEHLHNVSLRHEANPENPGEDYRASSEDFFDTWMRHKAVILTLLKGDRATVQYQLIKQLEETYMVEAREIGRGKVDPDYRYIAAYGAGANISFMLECLTRPGVDLARAREIYVDMQSRLSKMAVVGIREGAM